MNRRGFAMATAVMLIPIALIAIAAVSALVAADIRRTHDAIIEAQVQQMLLAGCLQAKRAEPLALPASLSADGATLRITPEDANHATVTVRLERTERAITIAVR